MYICHILHQWNCNILNTRKSIFLSLQVQNEMGELPGNLSKSVCLFDRNTYTTHYKINEDLLLQMNFKLTNNKNSICLHAGEQGIPKIKTYMRPIVKLPLGLCPKQ